MCQYTLCSSAVVLPDNRDVAEMTKLLMRFRHFFGRESRGGNSLLQFAPAAGRTAKAVARLVVVVSLWLFSPVVTTPL